MNNITKRNRLLAQIERYDAYLTICPPEFRFKLMEEMIDLRNQVNWIAAMNLNQLQTQIDEYYDTKPSKLNNENNIKNI